MIGLGPSPARVSRRAARRAGRWLRYHRSVGGMQPAVRPSSHRAQATNADRPSGREDHGLASLARSDTARCRRERTRTALRSRESVRNAGWEPSAALGTTYIRCLLGWSAPLRSGRKAPHPTRDAFVTAHCSRILVLLVTLANINGLGMDHLRDGSRARAQESPLAPTRRSALPFSLRAVRRLGRRPRRGTQCLGTARALPVPSKTSIAARVGDDIGPGHVGPVPRSAAESSSARGLTGGDFTMRRCRAQRSAASANVRRAGRHSCR